MCFLYFLILLYILSLQNEKQLCGVPGSVIMLLFHLSPSVGQAAKDLEILLDSFVHQVYFLFGYSMPDDIFVFGNSKQYQLR